MNSQRPALIDTGNTIEKKKEKNMLTKLTLKTVTERSNEFIVAWREFAPELTLVGRTLAQFETEKLLPEEVQQRILAAKAICQGLINERDQARVALKETLVSLSDAVRGEASHGLNSNFYRALGFIPKRERKSGLTRKLKTPNPPTTSAA
ncbi:MAG: hypothetical protein WCL19_11090 [Verrucomicrobiota bacterium]